MAILLAGRSRRSMQWFNAHLLPRPRALEDQALLHSPDPVSQGTVENGICGHGDCSPILGGLPAEFVVGGKSSTGDDYSDIAQGKSHIELGIVLLESEASTVVAQGIVGRIFEVGKIVRRYS